MTDGQKRKVWFEWSASSFLSASSLTFSMAPTSPTSGTFLQGGATDALSPRSPSPWDSRRMTRDAQGNLSPMVDAFASAPSPMMGQRRDRDSGRMQGIEEELGSGRGETRIKIGMSKLHKCVFPFELSVVEADIFWCAQPAGEDFMDWFVDRRGTLLIVIPRSARKEPLPLLLLSCWTCCRSRRQR